MENSSIVALGSWSVLTAIFIAVISFAYKKFSRKK
jgi:hypothetical protein